MRAFRPTFQQVILATVLVFSFTLVAVRSAYVTSTDNIGRNFIRGDGESDTNALSSARFFHDHGFLETFLRPVHNYDETQNGMPPKIYTHYPAAPELWQGLVSQILDTKAEVHLRWVSILLSILTVFLIYRNLKIFSQSAEELNLSLTLALLSGYFICFADNLQEHLHYMNIQFTTTLLFWSHYELKKQKILWAIGPALCIWISNVSPEATVFFAAVCVGSSIIFEKGVRKIISPLNIYLGAWSVLGLILHVYLNSKALGSLELAIADMTQAIDVRSGQAVGQISGHLQGQLSEHIPSGAKGITGWYWLTKPFTQINRIERYFLVPGFAMLIFGYWKWQSLRNSDKLNHAEFLIVILVSGYAWNLVMPQHALVHHFTARHLGVFHILVAGAGILTLRKILVSSYRQKKWPALAASLLLAVYISTMGLTQIVIPIWWDASLRYIFG
jgi:hypothetical protein